MSPLSPSELVLLGSWNEPRVSTPQPRRNVRNIERPGQLGDVETELSATSRCGPLRFLLTFGGGPTRRLGSHSRWNVLSHGTEISR